MSETSQEAANTAREIIKLKDKLITRLYENSVSSVYAVKLIDLLFEMPLISNKNVVERLQGRRGIRGISLRIMWRL